ncbi:hypothetical protein ANCCAN_13754, partial [Ancylostoma caninum]
MPNNAFSQEQVQKNILEVGHNRTASSQVVNDKETKTAIAEFGGAKGTDAKSGKSGHRQNVRSSASNGTVGKQRNSGFRYQEQNGYHDTSKERIEKVQKRRTQRTITEENNNKTAEVGMAPTIEEKGGEKYHSCTKKKDIQYDWNGHQDIHIHKADEQTPGRTGGTYDRGEHSGEKKMGWREQKTFKSILANTGRQEHVEKKEENIDNKRVLSTRRYDNKKDGMFQILKMDGMLSRGSQSKEENIPNKRQRYDSKRPKDSENLKGDESFMDKTMNQQEYVTVKGERYDTKRPKDSEILKGDGSFMDKTMNQQEYVTVK